MTAIDGAGAREYPFLTEDSLVILLELTLSFIRDPHYRQADDTPGCVAPQNRADGTKVLITFSAEGRVVKAAFAFAAF
jgi:hypothetical protein